MALELQGTLNVDCTGETFEYVQLTGLYNATTNLTGFGAPNLAIADIDSATLVITNLTTGVVYDDIDFTCSSTYGTTNEFGLSDILLDGVAITEILDGRWQFYLTVVGGGSTYTLDLQTVVVTDVRCGLKNVILNWCESGCNCSHGTERENMLRAYSKWIALTTARICDNADIDTQLDSLDDFLDSLSCNC